MWASAGLRGFGCTPWERGEKDCASPHWDGAGAVRGSIKVLFQRMQGSAWVRGSLELAPKECAAVEHGRVCGGNSGPRRQHGKVSKARVQCVFDVARERMCGTQQMCARA